MGRSNKKQGFKNLAKAVGELETPRFQKIYFVRGSSRLPFVISDDRLPGVVARFADSGWTVESEVTK